MLTWIINRRIAAFEKKFAYDMSYARDVLAADVRAFFAFARVTPMSEYRLECPRTRTGPRSWSGPHRRTAGRARS